jgi:glycosyltransferase involved in cell wall biosynthesis
MRPESVRVLLVGPEGHGGEEVYVRSILENPPEGVIYESVGGFHRGSKGARCRVGEEILLNRIVRPLTVPDIGVRSLRVDGAFELVHVHAHPTRLGNLGRRALIYSEGSSSAVYLSEYLGWDEKRLLRGYRRTRALYRVLGIHDRLLALERVSRAYVFSHWARDVNLQWGADPEKVEVVYPGFPTPAPVDRSERGAFTFLFVGTDLERKGGFEVIEAFAQLAVSYQEARLLLVCPHPSESNPDRRIHSFVDRSSRRRRISLFERLRCENRACWEPLCSREELYARVYPRADAFVMPSHAEGFGFTNVEALSHGLPVISSRQGAIPEVVRAGQTGLLVPAGDVPALSAAMEELVRDRARALDLGRAGREDFLDRFTMDRFRKSLAGVYARASGSPCAES